VAQSPKATDAPTKGGNMPWDEAIQKVLAEAGSALPYADIAQQIVLKGLRHSVGATPPSTVNSYISTSLREGTSPYHRVSRGVYTLKSVAEKGSQVEAAAVDNGDLEPDAGALRAFGMFWVRDAVLWTGKPKLLGSQGTGATNVNFADQIGVYLLHDRERVIYVGRATDTLLARLKAHTVDRLGGRWDRFSWFGLRNVGQNGELSDSAIPWSQDVVVETMEALLIESLEPPLNRRRGDNFAGVEYIQTIDPQIEKSKQKALLASIVSKADLE
jgi:hypothetical protein